MPFEYACFVSYRRGQGELMRRFVDDLEEALHSELEAQIGKKPFVDRTEMNAGDFFPTRLAEALCRSVCMLLVYTPTYFDLEHAYCGREYKTMEFLEARRLPALGAVGRRHGLIIPVILRGLERLPAEISADRQYHDFSAFTTAERRISRNPKYLRSIRSIAAYVGDRYVELAALPHDPCIDCTGATLVDEESVQPWLRQVQPLPLPFPR